MNKDRAHEMVEMPENENTGSSVDSTTLQNNDGKTVKHFSAKRIAYFGILTALEVVLTLWGSAIPVVSGSTAALNFSLIPIVLGAILQYLMCLLQQLALMNPMIFFVMP